MRIKKTYELKQQDNHKKDWLILSFLNSEWIFYFLFWVVITPMSFTLTQAVLFGSSYALASLLGTLIVIMPSGIIIREALFIMIGGYFGFSQEILIIYSVISRLVFTFSDIIFCALCYLNILIRLRLINEKKRK